MENRDERKQVSDQKTDRGQYCMLDAPATESPRSWNIPLKIKEWSWLKNHRLRSEVIFPAAGYVEAALEAANSCLDSQSVELHSVQFTQMLKLYPDNGTELEFKTQVNGKFHEFDITSRTLHADLSATTHSCGYLASGKEPRPRIQTSEFEMESKTLVSSQSVYEQLDEWEFQGDTSRWNIHEIHRSGEKDLFVTLKANSTKIHSDQSYLLDPSLLDLCFRCVLGLTKSHKVLMPYEIEKLQYWQDSPKEASLPNPIDFK